MEKSRITFRLKETAVRLTGGLHLSGLKDQTEKQSATAPERCGGRRQRSTGGKAIGGYLRDQCTVPRLWVVVVVAGEDCVDGGPSSGGRRFG